MTDHLLDVQRALSASRERLGVLAERLARVRQLARDRAMAPAAALALPDLSGDTGGASLPFGGADARPIDDVELTFRAVDIDGASDQDKAR